MPDDAWTVATAKARLSEVIDRARTHGPQLITRNGRPAAVVVGADEWERKTRRVGSLAEFFASSPLRERVDLQVERSADRPRAVTKFLLDTNAVSEWAKPSPDVGLARWLATTDEDGIYLSVITLAELRDGDRAAARGSSSRAIG